MPTLYLAITNHGFGHATRAAATAARIQERCPDLELIIATTAPEWLLKSYLLRSFTLRPRSFDVGVIQSDSLNMDKAATLEKLEQIRANQDELVAEEAAFLQSAGVDLVLADIPPLATAIAHAADIPCWMMSNFGWDFIYRPWGGGFAEIADWIADCFSQCDRLFRLPFHEPMSAFPHVTDVGLTGGNPAYSEAELRSRLLPEQPPERTVLLTFGGLGLAQIPYDSLAKFPDWQFITFDHQAPDLPNLYKVTDRRMRPVDWMPICDRVVSKPGYSTFAEACRLDKGIVTIPRQDFAEAAVLVAGMQQVTRHQILDAEAFFAGDWSFLQEPLQPPQTDRQIAKDGGNAIAQAVIDYLL